MDISFLCPFQENAIQPVCHVGADEGVLLFFQIVIPEDDLISGENRSMPMLRKNQIVYLTQGIAKPEIMRNPIAFSNTLHFHTI